MVFCLLRNHSIRSSISHHQYHAIIINGSNYCSLKRLIIGTASSSSSTTTTTTTITSTTDSKNDPDVHSFHSHNSCRCRHPNLVRQQSPLQFARQQERYHQQPQPQQHRSYASKSNTRTADTAAGPVIRFKNVSFGYTDAHLLLEKVDFSITQGSKVTIMGQNGSGKSTITKLLTQQIPNATMSDGQIVIRHEETIGYAMQTMPTQCRNLTIDQFFMYQLTGVIPPHSPPLLAADDETTIGVDENDTYDDDDDDASSLAVPRHEFLSKKGKVLKAVQMHDIVGTEGNRRIIKSFSGGQQARLLLAAALIQNPSILILDEPTNNMDVNGLEHLQNYIMTTDQTCIVISHDETFLNSFTDMVLYLDIHSKTVESYMGDYYYVKTEITKRIQRENADNARRQQKALAKKEQANKFANKGGNLRKIAKTMRQVAADMEESMVDVRREDISLQNFVIPYTQPKEFNGTFLRISQITGYNKSIPLSHGPLQVRKNMKIQLCGPNGIGKSTFLEMIVARTAPGVVFENQTNHNITNTTTDDCTIGYYRQDFYNFDFNMPVLQCLELASNHKHTTGDLYGIAAKFLLRGNSLLKQQTIGTLSEGQKGLLSLACLYVQEPTILIVDEPTNHMNFRHLPAIIHALSNFEGALLIVSHDTEFIQQVGPFDTVIDMGKEFQSVVVGTGKQQATKSAVAV